MRIGEKVWVYSFVGNKQLEGASFACATALLTLLAVFGLSGCAGLVSSPTGNPPPTLAITSVQVVSTTASGAQIVWTTNVPADSGVNYGTATSYGASTPVDVMPVISHMVNISGLAAGTTYYYQVTSTDSKNNQVNSGGHSFKTHGLSISGTITPTTGLSATTVALAGAANATTTTNGSGLYTFTGMARGSYSVTPSNPGYTFTPANQNVTLGTTDLTGVNFTATATAVAPTITTQPANQTVTAGQTATFSVVASGTAPLSYQWQKNGANIAGATSSSYTTPATTTADSGSTFDVVVSNSAGTATSTAATLTVNPAPVAPTITTQPVNQTVTAGQAAIFSVVASGTAPLSYQWQKNGANIAGATSSSYTTPATTTADGGSTFDVVVSNSAGTATSTAATLTVNPAPVAPTITTQPVNQTVTAGQTATFTVVASGTAPLTYQWQKNGANIGGATSSSYTTPATTTVDSGSTFDVVVSNTAGTVTSTAATLTVSPAPVAPTITTQPVNQTVTAGQAATFSVAASGTAPLTYQWQKNGAPISGATVATYTTPATTISDNGAQFIVVVSNSAGSVTSNAAALTVLTPQLVATPSSVGFGNVITGANNSQSIKLTNGGTASVTISQATVSGTGFSMSGLTTPLTIAAGTSAMFNAVFGPTVAGTASGSISLVSNAPNSPLAISLSGTGMTPTYLLGANPTSVGFGNVNVGANSSSNVTLTNNGNSNVTVSSLTVTGAGFSASGVSAGTTMAPNQSATLSIAFAPAAAGSVTGSVSVASNATNSPATIALSGSGVTPASSPFPVWVQSSLLRAGRTDPPGTASSITLSSARGETVDTQVIVQAPSSGLTNVNLSASTLSGPAGATIPAANITLYREYYITVTGTASYGGGSNPPLGSGTYPEPLIPFNDPETGSPLCATAATLKACNATVSAGQNQPYWIDISVPHGATNSPTGTYTGTISVTADQGTATIPVTLTVWNFGLPPQPSELSEWTLWNPNTGNTVTTLAQALMRNKVMSRYDVAASAASDITNFGLNRSGLDGYYFIGIQCNGSFSSIPSTSQITSAAANFPAGLLLDFYVADELNGCSGAYSALKTMGMNAHAATPGVKTLMTTNAPDPNLYNEGDGRSAIDHWVLLDAMQQWPSLPFTGAGDLWSYASCNTGFGNTPAWMVDYPPINERIQAGFLNWTQGATGILYWRADGWNAGNAIGSWNNVDTTGCGGGMGRPGDGIFLYPPAPIASTESAPGIRMKAIRDGIQDYEYAQILKNLGQLSFANPIVVPIATSWTNWTHSPSALEGARQQLGQQLNLLAPPGF
ncbi:MAG TPA: immunoglobulin domain-containing protein [Candidatus Acidoferrum sp.]